MGHQAGLKALRRVVEHCGQLGIRELTVFAFSSENWNRPPAEVSRLMDLFMRALDKEGNELHQNKVRIRFVGNLSGFSPALEDKIARVVARTPPDYKMTLNVAANYGGRWDITNAAKSVAIDLAAGRISAEQIDESLLAARLSTAGGTDPDLIIRTGGEMRISNFLLWQAAYSEWYFTPVLWPDFGPEDIDQAIEAFGSRDRRFGAIEPPAHEKAG
jgi:undecaprenyl diphosphate synthase